MTLRVLHVSKEFEPLSSGVARHIQGLANAMRDDRDIELTLLAPKVDVADVSCDVRQGGYGCLWSTIGESDVVHVHGARTPFSAVAALLAWLRGVPVVYTPHCYYDAGGPVLRALKRGWDLTVERFLVRRSGVVVLLHEGWLVDLAKRGLRPAKVLIVPNCIDDRRGAGQVTGERLEGAPALLSIGRLDPVKRLDDVIAALSVPSLQRAMLHIVGRGEDRARLEALAERSAVAARVHFHGWQDDAASARMMAGCDAMVLASEREGMPTVVLEALLAGVPIACSDIEGCRSITGAVGWDAVFPVGDIPALGSCLDRAARGSVPGHVVEAVRAGFTWQRKAPELAAAYLKLVRKRPARGFMKRLATYLSDYDNPRSLGARMRARRIGPLLAMIDEAYARHGWVNLVDVGGTQRYWNIVPQDYLDSRRVSITLINISQDKQAAIHPRFRLVEGDGCDLSAFHDKAFHVAHSNSVIEHVGGPDRIAKFTRELERVADDYFLQTPDFWCPLEPHCMTPFFHWLPRRARVWLVRRMDLGHWQRASSRDEAEALVDSARLLSRRELRALLPKARIVRERVLGLPKSLIAVGS